MADLRVGFGGGGGCVCLVVATGAVMTRAGSVSGHMRAKLKQLREAGTDGLPLQTWRQSEVVVPALIARGLVEVEVRHEDVEYLVITAAGLKEVDGGG